MCAGVGGGGVGRPPVRSYCDLCLPFPSAMLRLPPPSSSPSSDGRELTELPHTDTVPAEEVRGGGRRGQAELMCPRLH